MAPAKVWFLLLDGSNKPVGSPVEVHIENHISDLRKKAKEVMPIALAKVDYPSLIVWRVKEPKLFADAGSEELGETIRKIDFANKDLVFEPPSARKVVKLGLLANEMLLVQVLSNAD